MIAGILICIYLLGMVTTLRFAHVFIKSNPQSFKYRGDVFLMWLGCGFWSLIPSINLVVVMLDLMNIFFQSEWFNTPVKRK